MRQVRYYRILPLARRLIGSSDLYKFLNPVRDASHDRAGLGPHPVDLIYPPMAIAIDPGYNSYGYCHRMADTSAIWIKLINISMNGTCTL